MRMLGRKQWLHLLLDRLAGLLEKLTKPDALTSLLRSLKCEEIGAQRLRHLNHDEPDKETMH